MNRMRVLVALLLVAAPLTLAATAEAAPLNTIIKSGPSGTVTSTTATFTFKSKPRKGTSFQCRMDAGRFKKCTSPASYQGLAQGAHTFAVRAKRDGKKDTTPATRSFSIDSVAPGTTVTDGPPPVTDDHTPTFVFTSDDPTATFQCRLGTAAFAACTSPLTLPSNPDGEYAFQVRARDAAGNLDGTPPTLAFEILTPLTKDQATADAAAAYLVPDAADVDVPASCAGDVKVDCPDGTTPLPPADQLHVTATRSVLEVVGQDRYDADAQLGITTLEPFEVTYTGTTCDVSLVSANGAQPTWRLTFQELFVHAPSSSEWRIDIANAQLTQVDDADILVNASSPACALLGLSVGSVKGVLLDQLASQFSTSLCAARGPDYLGPCTT